MLALRGKGHEYKTPGIKNIPDTSKYFKRTTATSSINMIALDLNGMTGKIITA